MESNVVTNLGLQRRPIQPQCLFGRLVQPGCQADVPVLRRTGYAGWVVTCAGAAGDRRSQTHGPPSSVVPWSRHALKFQIDHNDPAKQTMLRKRMENCLADPDGEITGPPCVDHPLGTVTRAQCRRWRIQALPVIISIIGDYVHHRSSRTPRLP